MSPEAYIDPFEIASLVLCFIGSGFFSGSEAVLMSLGIDRAQQLIEEGGKKANAMTFMIEKPNELLTTILVGNNLVNIIAASLNTVLAARIFDSDGVGIAVGVTTILILIFGEIAPKTFARKHAENLSVFVIYTLRVFYILMFPAIKFIVFMIELLMGKNAELSGRMVTKNDLEYMINKAEQDQSIDSKQIDLLNSIMEFPTIKVKDIMVPRLEVKFINKDLGFQELITFVEEDGYSRYPVVDNELENCIGFLHIKDLAFIRGEAKRNFDLVSLLKEPFFVYEHMKIQAVFDYMNRKKVHLALVKDENGLVVGIITLEDIVEEILGEIQDEHDDEELEETSTNQDLVDGIAIEGSLSLRDLYSDHNIKIPLNDNYSTVAGFLLDMLGNSFPEQGQMIVWEGLSFELIKVEDFEIKEVRVKDIAGEKGLMNKREYQQEDTESPREGHVKKALSS